MAVFCYRILEKTIVGIISGFEGIPGVILSKMGTLWHLLNLLGENSGVEEERHRRDAHSLRGTKSEITWDVFQMAKMLGPKNTSMGSNLSSKTKINWTDAQV